MRLLVVSLAASLLACSGSACSGSKGTTDKAGPDQGKVTLFATTELKGTIEPCGCTSDPLGDLARTAELIARARSGKDTALYVDGGSLLYSKLPIPEAMVAQEQLKADLLVEAFGDDLQPVGVGLGPYDLAAGGEAPVQPARMAANVKPGQRVPVAPPKVVEAGGVKVGVFGVVAVGAVAQLGVEATDPEPAARAAVAELEKQGAQVVVALAHMTKTEAVALARSVDGIDFLLIGQNAPDDPKRLSGAPEKVGGTWLFQPADRGQVVSRLDLTYRGPGGFADAIGEARAAAERADIDERLPALRADLEKWSQAEDADPTFLATKKKELAALEARRKALAEKPLQPPDEGSYFTLAQIEIDKGLPCSEEVVAAKQAYDKAAGLANFKAAKDDLPPEPAPGEAGFVGAEECSFCHADAVEFWKGTRHFEAWETLEVQDKQFNLDCIGCHVTGWQQPGGSTLGVNEHLRDVQCETCHGPGSLHVDAEGAALKETVELVPPEDLCVGCHNPEHSDTFDYEAYLRDVTGPGHGEAFRERLGDGPTGHELRSAALKAAGAKIGAGCPK